MVYQRFKEDYADKTLKELIDERQKVIKEISRIESTFYNQKEVDVIIEPSPVVVWNVLNKDLIMLTELINDKAINDDTLY